MTVIELAASLGLEVNQAEWNTAKEVAKDLLDQLKKLAIQAALATTDVKKAMDVIGLPAVQAKGKLEGLQKTGEKVGGMFKWLAGAAAGFFAVSHMKGAIDDATAYGGKLNDMAQSTGTGIEKLQELGYAASQNSSGLDEVADVLVKLGKNAGEAAAGGKSQAEAFAAMGIAVTDADGKVRPAADLLDDVADRLASLPDGTQKTNEAISVLGKSGNALIPTLNGGSKGLADMATKARDLGGVVSTDSVHALDDFGDVVDDVKFALTGMARGVVADVLPTLKELADSFLAWVKANKKLIAQRLVAIFKGIIKVVQMLSTVIGVIVDVLGFLVDHLDLVIVALTAMGVAMLILRAKSIATAIMSALAWAAAALPFVLIAVLIGAVILVLEDLYQAFTGGNSIFKDFYEGAKYWIGEKIADVINGLIDKINYVYEKIQDAKNFIQKNAQDQAVDRTIDDQKAALEAQQNTPDSVKQVGYAIFEKRRAAYKGAFANERKRERVANGTFIDHIKPEESETDKAVANYNSPEAIKARAANIERQRLNGTMPTMSGLSHEQAMAPNQTNAITINVPAGTDAKALGNVVTGAIKDHWDALLRGAAVGTGVKK